MLHFLYNYECTLKYVHCYLRVSYLYKYSNVGLGIIYRFLNIESIVFGASLIELVMTCNVSI